MSISDAASQLGKRSLQGRMKKLTPEQRTEFARNAARARWAKTPKAENPRQKRRKREAAA